jgi:hypothetical protein
MEHDRHYGDLALCDRREGRALSPQNLGFRRQRKRGIGGVKRQCSSPSAIMCNRKSSQMVEPLFRIVCVVGADRKAREGGCWSEKEEGKKRQCRQTETRKMREAREVNKGAVARGRLVVQFASASGELLKRFGDGVTVRSRLSRAGRRRARAAGAQTVIDARNRSQPSSAETSVPVKRNQVKKQRQENLPVLASKGRSKRQQHTRRTPPTGREKGRVRGKMRLG